MSRFANIISNSQNVEQVYDTALFQVNSFLKNGDLTESIDILESLKICLEDTKSRSFEDGEASSSIKEDESGFKDLLSCKHPELIPFYLYTTYRKLHLIRMRLATSLSKQSDTAKSRSQAQYAVADAREMVHNCSHEPLGYYSLARSLIFLNQLIEAFESLEMGIRLTDLTKRHDPSDSYIQEHEKLKSLKANLQKRLSTEDIKRATKNIERRIKDKECEVDVAISDTKEKHTLPKLKFGNALKYTKQKKLDFKVIDRQEMEKSQLVSKQSQPALNKTDPMEILPYPDIFRPIIMSLDFPSILECTKVNKFWRRMLTKYDQLILPEKFDSTLNGMKKIWKPKELHTTLYKMTVSNKDIIINKVELLDVQTLNVLTIPLKTFRGRIRNLVLHCKQQLLFFEFFGQLYARKSDGSGIYVDPVLESLELHGACTTDLIEVILPSYPNLKRLHVTNTESRTPEIYAFTFATAETQRRQELQKQEIDFDTETTTRNTFDLFNSKIPNNIHVLELQGIDLTNAPFWRAVLKKITTSSVTLPFKKFSLTILSPATFLRYAFFSSLIIKSIEKMTQLESFEYGNLPINYSPMLRSKVLKSVKIANQRFAQGLNPTSDDEEILNIPLTNRVSVPKKLDESVSYLQDFGFGQANTLSTDQQFSKSHASYEQFPVESLNMSMCSFSDTSYEMSIPDIHRFFARTGCGSNLKALQLEYVRFKPIYEPSGYDQLIRKEFPNLQLLSLAGNAEVGDTTAAAIIQKKPFPKAVILSHTSTSVHGFWMLINAGVTKIGLQRCYIPYQDLEEIKNRTDITLLEKQFHVKTNRNDKVV